MSAIDYSEVVNGQFHVLSEFTKFSEGEETSVFLGYIEGLASTPDIDRDTEIISEKALQEGSGQLLNNDSVFFNHQHLEVPLGRVIEAGYVQGKGLYVKVGISKNYPAIWQSIEEGSLKAFSIAGEFLEWETQENVINDKTIDVRVVTKVNLYEVSVVGIPANEKAKFTPLIAKYFDLSSAKSKVEDEKSTKIIKTKMKEEISMPPDEITKTEITEPDEIKELASKVEALSDTVDKSAEIANSTAELFNKFLETQIKPKEEVVPAKIVEVVQPEIVPRTTVQRQDHTKQKFANTREYEIYEVEEFAKALLHPDAIKIDMYGTLAPKYPGMPRLFKEDRR